MMDEAPVDDTDGGVPIDEPLLERLTDEVAARAELLRERIAESTDRPVRVVAVTKGHPPEAALAAFRAGFEDLGENYAQELLAKHPAVPAARWHFLGHLQRNKVRLLAGKVDLWQSVDRESAVRELAKRAPGARVLLQADLAGTEGRAGAARGAVEGLLGTARGAGLVVEGLMGIAPPDPDAAREAFRWLSGEAGRLGLTEVSMGMSGDLEAALREGATIVRVGTALLGPRPDPGRARGSMPGSGRA